MLLAACASKIQNETSKLLTPPEEGGGVSSPPRGPQHQAEKEVSRGHSSSEDGRVLKTLVIATWACGAVFGSFALLHYLRHYYFHFGSEPTQHAWDRMNPHLYRPDRPLANRVMVAHFIGGVFLMFAGPIQFIPQIRRPYLRFHRWIGRLYVLAGIAAGGGGLLFTLGWRTSRCNVHEDLGNIIMGACTFVCAIQTYVQVAIRRDIPRHELWAWRMYASVLGAPLYRLYAVIYGLLVLYTPWEGAMWIENGLFYIIVIPNLMVVEFIWRKRQQRREGETEQHNSNVVAIEDGQEKTMSPASSQQPLVPPWVMQVAIGFAICTTSMSFFSTWLPTILGFDLHMVASFLHDFCPAHQ